MTVVLIIAVCRVRPSTAAIVMQLLRLERYESCMSSDDNRYIFRRLVFMRLFCTLLFNLGADVSPSVWITSGRKHLDPVCLKRKLLGVKSTEQLLFPFTIFDFSSKAFCFVHPDQSYGTSICNCALSHCKSGIHNSSTSCFNLLLHFCWQTYEDSAAQNGDGSNATI
jgi:hypothetical protein